MNVVLTEFYTEPRFTFKISHKVYRELDKQINKVVKKASKKIEFTPSELWIIVNSRRIKSLKISKAVKFGTGKKKDKVILMLPYETLKKSKNFLKNFITLVCDAVVEIIHAYGVPLESLTKLKEECLNEILENPKYKYVDENL